GSSDLGRALVIIVQAGERMEVGVTAVDREGFAVQCLFGCREFFKLLLGVELLALLDYGQYFLCRFQTALVRLAAGVQPDALYLLRNDPFSFGQIGDAARV